jgi:hypothetical protein
MVIAGSCHCGNISFRLRWEPDPTEIAARACGCSFCVKHGGVWTSNPRGALEVTLRGAVTYAFGTETAQFHVCARCGVVPLVTSEIDGRRYAVVSVNAFDNVDRSIIRISPASFDGEEVGDRLARRKRGWIPDVVISDSPGPAD